MGNVTQRLTGQSQRSVRTILKSISGLALVSVLISAAANGIEGPGKVSLEAHSPQGATNQRPEFYVSLATDERDQPGLSTLVVAGSNRFMFDCGIVGSVPGTVTAPRVTTLFLTNLETATAEGIDRALSDTPTASPPRIWGPPGTREWILQAMGDRELNSQRPPFTVIDLQEGVISEAAKATITAIETAPSRFAYRVGFEGGSLLIASDVTYSEHLAARSAGVDVLVLRHTELTETVRLLQRIKPGLAVLSPDGRSATVAQIREQYAGAIQLFGAGAHQIHVLEHLALDDVKEPRR